MRKLLVGVVLTVSLMFSGVIVAAPAGAHFMYGANCHINIVQPYSGRVSVRLVNRTYTPAIVEIGLRTNDGQTRFWSKYLPARWYVNRWIYLPGNWTVVRITHCHIYG